MYKILVYNGGVYRFDELVEFVEDSGGLILRRDDFQISRGVYFISQEVHVIIITPQEVVQDLEDMARELKGDITQLDVEYEDKINVVSLLPLYNLLSSTNEWTDIKTIEKKLECPCVDGVCQEFIKSPCIEDITKTLEAMCRMEIVESRESNGNIEYKLKIED